ncbi:hypothetical protein PGT21_028313 [Puccinia graminis f. sp. tritici]|uniref:Uncharacterized protein n=1 Tax=Puccinia graminis f. sp. tritici TaxID=56615 RepID=A0A5B0PYU0_PUCGR|nr:hypothetical protein PGT21_028313 [Puccinia graminis f. sp. tritici]
MKIHTASGNFGQGRHGSPTNTTPPSCSASWFDSQALPSNFKIKAIQIAATTSINEQLTKTKPNCNLTTPAPSLTLIASAASVYSSIEASKFKLV